MKAVAIIAFFALFLTMFKGEFFPGSGSFYVRSVQEGLTESKYQLVQTQGNGSTWIVAGRGLYHVGDTLQLSKP